MATADRRFGGAIPEIYDRYLVPLLFEPYARDLARRLAAFNPRDVLETAAGTGVLTRAIAARLPAEARVTATDLNQPMLDRAIARSPSDARVRWMQADALALPFADQSFDAVACQFGMMFFPDKVAGHREAHRVLRPGGYLLCSSWDRIAQNDFPRIVMEALATLFPDNPPDFIARIPHGYYEPETIRNDLTAAGFGDVRVEAIEEVSRSPSAHDVAVAFCQGTPIRSEIEARDPARLEEATRVAANALERRFGAGPIEGRIRALIATARC